MDVYLCPRDDRLFLNELPFPEWRYWIRYLSMTQSKQSLLFIDIIIIEINFTEMDEEVFEVQLWEETQR